MAKAKWQGWGAVVRQAFSGLWRELVILHRQPVFLANCYGFVPVSAVLGVYTFWGPKVGALSPFLGHLHAPCMHFPVTLFPCGLPTPSPGRGVPSAGPARGCSFMRLLGESSHPHGHACGA